MGALGSSLPQAGRARRRALVHGVEVGLARKASPAWPSRSCPTPCSAWAARLPGLSGLARNLSGFTFSSAPFMACLIPGGPGLALATPGSLLYIFKTSFYSL